VTSERDPYHVLGVDPAADPDIIAAAYRTLARLHHPDVSQSPDAARLMAEINAAWSVLKDDRRRAAWDREHGVIRSMPQAPWTSPAAGGSSAAPATPPGSPAHPAPSTGPVRWHRGPDGEGAAGPPPGSPRGSVLPFGRHIGWSLGEIARVDAGYLQWLAARPEGAPWRTEIEAILERLGAAPASPARSAKDRRGFNRS
jgi:curved DNA-binding protein CbpA